mmetsp:Transcript_6784/g.9904  ORF Transcript_6784/g.9904 Transcript_6784/m.9904 type:complete len:229 (-) Transcript_6784:49-735(-)|eukprot:CAMPEP_0194211290 /NCGR_PEP_ID=MMETSP0156-20130528/9922_1 /TAXON_ID=33649 /ORGANISM="Thalassionema nitzschioides, Strain L26-B" /LENGTH=228 /DNA_ID=CAMNT_0038938799 /DNA_START=45 /DNA_END=731 /DNA_ORIENTATION=+
MLSQEKRWMLIVLIPSVWGFAPLMPTANIDNSQCIRRELAVDPSDITSSAMQIWNHSPLESLLSTLYVDPALSKIHSIPPVPGTIVHAATHASTGFAGVSEQMRETIDFAQEKGNFLDPNEIKRIDISPGFSVSHGFLPEVTPISDTERYRQGVAMFEMDNLRLLMKAPIVAVITALVDFFVVTPGMDVFKEDIDENESQMVTQSVIQSATRIAVLGVVAGITLVLSG